MLRRAATTPPADSAGRLRRPDGEIVADSGQGYRRLADCEADLAWLRGDAAFVPVHYPETGGLPQGEPGEAD
jgi:hypothetical protein